MNETQNNLNQTQNESTNTTASVDSSVDAFLKQNVTTDLPTKEIKFSRFNASFKIQALSSDKLEELQKDATTAKRDPRTQQTIKSVDQDKLTDLMLAESVVTPNLNNQELQESWGAVADPAGLLRKMLLAGEFANLGQEVQALSGFYQDLNDNVESVKK